MPNDPISPPVILELDYVFEALNHPRRRYVLYTLSEDSEWPLEVLATKLAAWESDTKERPPEDEIDHVYICLYHNHVPKLAADDIIEFDPVTETISPGPNAEQVLRVLENAGGITETQLQTHAQEGYDDGRT